MSRFSTAGGVEYQQRPVLRGVSHLGAAIAAVLGLPVLLLIAGSPREYVAAALFAASLVLLYATSAGYHLIAWRPALRGLIRRLDHSMIFVLIVGTYTPFCLLAVDLAWGISILSVAGGVAAIGITVKLAWPHAPRWLGVAFYLALGWLGLAAAPEVLEEFTAGSLALLVGGGVLYTLGGVVYALRWPDPHPRVFGYHETFHLLVIGGTALHYWLIVTYLAG